jgi:hypothetical protein
MTYVYLEHTTVTPVQVLLQEEEREQFRRQAEREELSLSAWLRRAGQERLRSRQGRRISTVRELREFFREIDAREKGREPEVRGRPVCTRARWCPRRAGRPGPPSSRVLSPTRGDTIKTFDRPLAAAFRKKRGQGREDRR